MEVEDAEITIAHYIQIAVGVFHGSYGKGQGGVIRHRRNAVFYQ